VNALTNTLVSANIFMIHSRQIIEQWDIEYYRSAP